MLTHRRRRRADPDCLLLAGEDGPDHQGDRSDNSTAGFNAAETQDHMPRQRVLTVLRLSALQRLRPII